MTRMYSVKEIFYTLQGEGANAGRAAVFCRFAGCNLWSGREEDRQAAQCSFCDTDFVGMDGPGGGRFAAASDLAGACRAAAGAAGASLLVLTGGEPMLQVDDPLIEALHKEGFRIAIETNGTLAVPATIDWICVSPKAGTRLEQRTGQELKLVYPQEGLPPEAVEGLAFTHHFLQPMDGPERDRNTALAVAYCKAHPRWRLSLQSHKLIGIP
ncbi:MAG: 7-carboxy-7-deazaguanine synthase [Hyphomonadaceae bacterium]|nr:7-carboxy-7-deazaguanine synthase [Hyphomonadaceae bacterium]